MSMMCIFFQVLQSWIYPWRVFDNLNHFCEEQYIFLEVFCKRDLQVFQTVLGKRWDWFRKLQNVLCSSRECFYRKNSNNLRALVKVQVGECLSHNGESREEIFSNGWVFKGSTIHSFSTKNSSSSTLVSSPNSRLLLFWFPKLSSSGCNFFSIFITNFLKTQQKCFN